MKETWVDEFWITPYWPNQHSIVKGSFTERFKRPCIKTVFKIFSNALWEKSQKNRFKTVCGICVLRYAKPWVQTENQLHQNLSWNCAPDLLYCVLKISCVKTVYMSFYNAWHELIGKVWVKTLQIIVHDLIWKYKFNF